VTPDALLALAVLALAVAGLAAEVLNPDVLLVAALASLVALGVVDMETALRGFASPVLVTLAGLFVVAAGLRATGVLELAADGVLGRGTGLRTTLARLVGAAASSSAFVSNTAVVAMGIPAVTGWARRHGVSPSRVLIPLSYASILGGVCTLLGTSTNLVADDLLRSRGLEGLGFFELALVGLPLAAVGLVYLVALGPRLLPDREPDKSPQEKAREYVADMRVPPGSELAGETVEEAGLRRLPGLFLVRIERETGTVAPVTPAERLAAGDRLTFAGVIDRIAELRRIRGLEAASAGRRASGAPAGGDGAAGGSGPSGGDPPPPDDPGWELHEAVVSPGSPLVGTSVRDAEFRARYNAAVMAVHRHGEKIEERIGDIVLRPGDTLVLEAAPGFSRAYRDSSDFYLVSRVDEAGSRPRRGHAWRAVAVLVATVGAAATGLVSLPLAALGGGLATVLTGCATYGEARRSIDWSVLVVIGCALGIAAALEASGAAAAVGTALASTAEAAGPTGLLAAVVLGTMVLTEMITNNAAVALVFPLVATAASAQGLDPRPLLLGATVAASLSMATPLGYQTNLMVFGPGKYRYLDFVRVGVPLQLLLAAGTVALVRWWWPLAG
jgi:di/tricarboxylate transporter